jgi:hypothetical protein
MATDGAGDSGATGEQPAADAGAGAERRLRLGLPPIWVSVAIALVGVVLLVIGGLGYIGASSDNSDADRATKQRHELEARAAKARSARVAIVNASTKLVDQIQELDAAGASVTDAENALTDASNAAVAQANRGNVSAARAAFQSEDGLLADLDAKLNSVRDALVRAKQRLDELKAQEKPS